MLLQARPFLLFSLATLIMHSHAALPVRLLTHNIRYAADPPSKGEKVWAVRKPLIVNELRYNTLHNREAFICLQEVLHNQLVDIMSGLGSEFTYVGVGRDDGKEKGEYSPIIFRKAVWEVESWRTVWLNEDGTVGKKGWDAGSVRIVTVGHFKHVQSKKRVLGLCTHFDNAGDVSRRESARIVLKIIESEATNSTSKAPFFLAGDLNSETSGEAYQLLNANSSPLQDAKTLAAWKYGDDNYSLGNPDTLTKYKVAAEISQKVLKEVSGWIKADASIVELCERGDQLLAEEVGKVYKGKKVLKGIGHCTTISPSSYVTPYTPLKSDTEEAAATLKEGEVVKIQLGAQIDGFCTIVCDNVIVGNDGEVTGREADLILATYYANELLLRLMVPPGLVVQGDEEEQKKASAKKAYTQTQITQMLEKVTKAYECNLVESTTIWLFDHNEIEAKKKIILAPGEGVKGEGLPEVGEVWGVEMGVSLGSGKVKTNGNRTTLHRRTETKYALKRPTSRALLSEVVKKFGTFPFSLRQLEDEKTGKVGVVECVRSGVLRQYEVVVDKDSKPVARLFSTVAITKNGMQRLAQPPALDLEKYKSDKKIEDEEILKILEQPIGKTSTKKNKKKKKKPAKKAAAGGADAEEEEGSDEESPLMTSDEHLNIKNLVICRRIRRYGMFRCALYFLHVAMPALRKSARAAPHHRSSTTPYASPTGTPSESTGGKRQSLMTDWTEPAPQTLAPSFEEHGFARHGVLETMAPLGVPPSAKVKQRTRAMGEAAARNAVFGKGNAAFGDEVSSTPEVTPAPELEPDDSERQEEDEMQIDFAMHEEEEDDDYEPKTKAKKKPKISKTPVRGKTPVPGRTPVQGKTPIKNRTGKTASVSASPAVQAVQPTQLPPQDPESAQRIHTAVNDAVLRANREQRWQIGIALKELWEESKHDVAMADIIDSIIHERITDEQYSIFRAFIKKSRKRQRNEAKLKRLQEDSGRRAADIYGNASLSHQPSPRGSSEVIPDDSVSAVNDTADQDLTVPLTSGTTNAHRALQASIEQMSAGAPPHPFNTAPAIPAANTSGESTPRMSSKSPRKKAAANGHLAPNGDMEDDGGLSTKAPTPAGKTPETGGDSDSDLSEVNEEIVQKGPPEPVQADGKISAAAAAHAKKIKSAALARAAKKAKPNAGKLFGKHAHKQQQPTPEQLAEQEQALEARKDMMKQQLINQYNPDFPVSDVRFDDEINDTESLTESQIAVGPPVDSDQPRRAGRVPHHNAKRLREDGPLRFSSPLPESAAGTRPSTPAVGGPAHKRIKLTHNNAAKTKRSPVKNREAGPIAGVAYVNGGGGSRQLGPDDNDPNSPQSESDDLCSACKGAGEFVCCETCPRVFHLLCCDPPRVDVPEGAFFCHECKAKGATDESAAESFPSLGPLFKNLERTNPRAFALPHEIQTLFEGVTARSDGSYFEEVKKFPLAKNSGYGYQRPDYTRVFDGDQKAILCVQCGASSGHKRPMLKCDYCQANWHLDCLDPPLANPPNISLEASQRDAWRCPRHTEHDLRSGLLLQHDLNEDDVDMIDAPRIARKIRKRKHAHVIEPTFSRGMRNNGLIDIINDTDDDTDGEGNYVFGPDDPKDLNSKVFRVPERGVILDFVSKVKSGRVQKDFAALKTAKSAARQKAFMQDFTARPVIQQQAALNLARLAGKEQDIGLSAGKLDVLLLRVTAEANNDVTTALDSAPPPPASSDERAELLKLQELIARRLQG
ncbi:hypothetical protein BKA63DRAFT_405592 [Paraphoma chrysanthemicola]|nr:hypothetical protein BKA63DRAFT_405592 [Paraphoma chrysanthemicola]